MAAARRIALFKICGSPQLRQALCRQNINLGLLSKLTRAHKLHTRRALPVLVMHSGRTTAIYIYTRRNIKSLHRFFKIVSWYFFCKTRFFFPPRFVFCQRFSASRAQPSLSLDESDIPPKSKAGDSPRAPGAPPPLRCSTARTRVMSRRSRAVSMSS